MKAAIVSFSAVQKHKRLDAGYYLGTDGAAREVEQRKKNIADEKRRLADAEQRATEEAAIHQQMVESGEVKPL